MPDCQSFGNLFMRGIDFYGKANATPTSATFELTPLCNFNCPMCYVHKKRTPEVEAQMLSTEQWLDLARQARDMGVIKLTLTGGEIFTRPDFWAIYSEINKMGFLVSLLSNGYLIDEGVIEKFNEYGAPFGMKLSLYGASNGTYEKMCGVKNGFDRFSHAVDLLKEAGIPFNVTSTVVKENVDDLQDMYRFAAEKKFEFKHTITVVKSTREADSNPENSRIYLKEYLGELSCELAENMRHDPYKTPFGMCSSFRRSFWISWNGKMQNCSFASEPCVSIVDKKLSDAWTLLVKMLEQISLPDKCSNCKYKEFCRVCPGIFFAEGINDKQATINKFCEESELIYNVYHHERM